MALHTQTTSISETTADGIDYTGTDTWNISFGVSVTSESGRAVFSSFDQSGLVNFGLVHSEENWAVEMTGFECVIVNFGEIIGDAAILARPDISIANLGKIVSTGLGPGNAVSASADPMPRAAITLQGPGGSTTTKIVNTGVIIAESTAILSLAGEVSMSNTGEVFGHIDFSAMGDDLLGNAGSIFGNVMLGGGADAYDGHGGLVHGTVFGEGGRDRLVGGDAEDFLHGGNGRDVIRGGAGDDVIDGGGGRDRLRGGSGDDVIDGGGGRDSLRGGSGDDAFVFADPGKVDRVLDFNLRDRIHLENAAFAGLGKAGELSSGAFHIGAKATDDDHRVIYNAETGALKHDANGSGKGGVTKIAKLSLGLDLTHHHFEII